jgi:hypothetical protein
MKAYHVTDEVGYTGIIADGCIKTCRLANVYLFKDRADAESYLVEFGKSHIIEVEIANSQIESRWKPSYARDGVIKLKKGEICLTT